MGVSDPSFPLARWQKWAAVIVASFVIVITVVAVNMNWAIQRQREHRKLTDASIQGS
jgi:putative effector of murein hydrolase LrgA (UPF0299 family)